MKMPSCVTWLGVVAFGLGLVSGAPEPSPAHLITRASAINVVDFVSTWCRGKLIDINYASLSKGGWEGWTQVELSNQRQRLPEYKQKADLFREVMVYQGTNERADLVFKTLPSGGPADQDVVELKCEIRTEGQSGNRSLDAFFGNVNDDISKVKNGVMRQEYAGAARSVIAISVTKGGQQYLEDKWRNYTDKPTAATVIPSIDVDIIVWVWRA